MDFPEGNAIVYCQNQFGKSRGKTANGLVRRTNRYRIMAVLDARLEGRDAGEVLDGKPNGIPVAATLEEAMEISRRKGSPATHFVMGLAPDGGRLTALDRASVREAILAGLHVDSGLHDFLSEDPEFSRLAEEHHVRLRDVRKTPPREALHAFSGKINEVTSFRVALLGTDSGVGKRTTAWCLVDAFREKGYTAELIGTGQTAWLQGAEFGIRLDSLVNDFVAGELEHAVWSAWKAKRPDVLVIEGQGSLMHPAYPGGLEILAAARPHAIVLQHAPARKEYEGFPGFAMPPLTAQIRALELISGCPVAAVTLNHEEIEPERLAKVAEAVSREADLPAVDVLLEGAGRVVETLRPYYSNKGPLKK